MTGQCGKSSLGRSGTNREIRYETTWDTTARHDRPWTLGRAGVSIRATRNPTTLYRSPMVDPLRFAERTSLGRLFQVPPAKQFPLAGSSRKVDEVRHRLRIVAPVSQILGQLREGRRRPLRHRLPCLAGPQPLRVRHRPLELVARRAVREVVERELVRHAYAVRPVVADAEPRHVGDDQQRRVLQRERVLPQLIERRVEIGAPALVLPGEAAALPYVGPAAEAGVLPRAALEAVPLARRVGLGSAAMASTRATVGS